MSKMFPKGLKLLKEGIGEMFKSYHYCEQEALETVANVSTGGLYGMAKGKIDAGKNAKKAIANQQNALAAQDADKKRKAALTQGRREEFQNSMDQGIEGTANTRGRGLFGN